MRKVIISILWLFCGLSTFGQSVEESVVRQFGNNLRDWCSTKNTDYRMRAQKQCIDACRVEDRIMTDFVRQSSLSVSDLRNFVIQSYLNGFEDAMDKGVINISITSIIPINKEERSYSTKDKSTVSKQEKLAKNYATFCCNISVTGMLNYNIQDTYYVRKGQRAKIAKITPYEEEVDPNTGKRKVKLDFNDLEEISMLGFLINHDQHFPVGASIIGQSGWFMCSLDFGINLDSKKYYKEKMDMTNIMNYSSTRTEYDPKMFFTITPAVFLKYVSVGCGIGFTWLDCKEEISERKTNFNDDGSYSGYTSGSTFTNAAKVEFMLRPQIRGYIPLSSSCNMSIGAGYDIVPKIKKLNGYNVSIGFHFDFDEWENLFKWW